MSRAGSRARSQGGAPVALALAPTATNGGVYALRLGSFLIYNALIAGWAVAAVFAPSSTVLVALLTALLGGSILLNVFKEEIPANRGSSFGWFLTGLILYAGLLGAVTVLAQ